jgi:rSAM/selenodomain-associated transferase 2
MIAVLLLPSPKKGRASQMNHGASHATGDVFWFLHADSIPPADSLSQIRDVLHRKHDAGCFRIRFDSRHPLMLYNSFMSNLRVKSRKTAFGDQGIFVRRELFAKIGGFADIPLMEDYQFSIDVRNAGVSLGVTEGFLTTSERRYLAHGRIKTMVKMLAAQRRFKRGDDIAEIAKAYDA